MEGGGREGLGPSLDFESFSKNVACLVSSGKKQISPLLASPRKLLGISPSGSPGKNSYDAHGHVRNVSTLEIYRPFIMCEKGRLKKASAQSSSYFTSVARFVLVFSRLFCSAAWLLQDNPPLTFCQNCFFTHEAQENLKNYRIWFSWPGSAHYYFVAMPWLEITFFRYSWHYKRYKWKQWWYA